MDVSSYSKRCIQKYLDKYNISLGVSEKFEKYDIVNGSIVISTKHDPEFGEFEYYFDGKELFIKKICIKQIKHNVPIKLLKVFLLYLLSMYSDSARYVKLIADPYACDSLIGVGREFCLSCYYQQLGFEPEDVDFTKYIEQCLVELDPKYKKLSSMCLLCKCQEKIKSKEISIEDFGNFKNVKVSMKALIPKLKKALKSAYKEITL